MKGYTTDAVKMFEAMDAYTSALSIKTAFYTSQGAGRRFPASRLLTPAQRLAFRRGVAHYQRQKRQRAMAAEASR